MKNKKVLFLFLFLLTTFAFTQEKGQKFEITKEGFRDFKWGEKIEQRKDMKQAGEMGQIKIYKRENEDLRLGTEKNKVDDILYCATKEGLFSVRIYFKEKSKSNLLTYFSKYLGHPSKTKQKGLETYTWENNGVSISLQYILLNKNGIVEITKIKK